MEDETGKIIKHKKLETYPATFDVDGETITVVDTLSHRFLTQTIYTNTPNSIINTGGMSEEYEVKGSITVHLTSDDRMMICMKDELFFPKGKWKTIKEKGYIYDAYSRAFEDYKMLGYADQFAEWSANNKAILEMMKERNLYVMNWWIERNFND